MSTSKVLNDHLSDFFFKWVQENLTLQKKAYFVTLTFERIQSMSRRREAEGLSIGSFEMNAFHTLYNQVSRKLVGRNYNRASQFERLPRAATFLDAEGSKFWRSAGEFSNLHLHSIWIIDASKDANFKTSLSLTSSYSSIRALGFDDIDVQEIESTNLEELKRVTTYSSKFLKFNNNDLRVGKDFEIYPLNR